MAEGTIVLESRFPCFTSVTVGFISEDLLPKGGKSLILGPSRKGVGGPGSGGGPGGVPNTILGMDEP